MKTVILLLPGNAVYCREVLRQHTEDYGWLLSPQRTMTRAGFHGLRMYGVDNGCYTGRFDAERFVGTLERIKAAHGTAGCLFVAAPDVVCDPWRTWAQFEEWCPTIRSMGFPVALVGQNGCEEQRLPWKEIDALFVGGDTAWKLGPGAAEVMAQARAHGKWVHVGRVSSWMRFDQMRVKPHSIDGTHWVKRPDRYLAAWHNELLARKLNMRLGI